MPNRRDPDAIVKPHLERLARLATNAERSTYRRRVTENDPLLFALLYLRKHLTDKTTNTRSLSRVHVEWAESAKTWATPVTKPASSRTAEVAPREMGKSTWWFLLLPMWAAAHRHVNFTAAFADTEQQAQTHLASFKRELENNALLRADYPDLVAPKTRGRGTVEADRVSLYHARSGFVFAAAGMDSSNLGMKVGDQRPDLIILDDIEPHEARYSAALAKKRLATLREAILPLNIYARVILVGTVTMVGSIVHQVVKHSRGEVDDENAWVAEERITARHYPAIITKNSGKRASIWPAKWPLAFLESIEGTRQYAKNYANDPLGADGDYWTLEDFVRAPLENITHVLIEVDPAVTTKKSSDFTGIAVLGYSALTKKVVVLEARQVKKGPDDVRIDVINTINRWNAGLVRVETNQGGELWAKILWGLPVKLKLMSNSLPKEVRAADALVHYQRGRVLHDPDAKLADLEGQMVAFPNAPHDDMVDAVGNGVRYFLSRGNAKPGSKVGGSSQSYV